MKKYPKKLSNAGKTIWDIYRDLYKHATPSVDFDYLFKTSPKEVDVNGVERSLVPYDDYVISDDLYNSIVERHLERNRWNIRDNEKMGVRMEAFLGCGPRSEVADAKIII